MKFLTAFALGAFAASSLFAGVPEARTSSASSAPYVLAPGTAPAFILADGHKASPKSSPPPKTPAKQPAKETKKPETPPLHNIRKDLGYSDTKELRRLHERIKNPDKDVMDPKSARQAYDRLYRKFYKERAELIKKAMGEEAGAVRTAYLEQALGLTKDLDKLPAPKAKKGETFSTWAPFEKHYIKLITRKDKIEQIMVRADKVVNGTSWQKALSYLVKLSSQIRIAKELQKEVDDFKRDFILSGIMSRRFNSAAGEQMLRAHKDHEKIFKKLQNYQKDYIQAVNRKWPDKLHIQETGKPKP